jgi:CDP-glucose 4,6-dehydratase
MGEVEEKQVNSEFWSNKKVLITGHTGFKGSWLSLWLQHRGAIVTGLALDPPTTPSLFNIANVAEGMTSIIGDIRDGAVVKEAFKRSDPDIVIHMAAQPLVLYSYDNPVATYETNVMGTVHILEACRESNSLKAAVMITTDKCYENKEWVWAYRENEPMGGYDPYSNSKGCSELVISAYRQSFFNSGGHPAAIASARAGNVIGGGDWAADRLIPDFMHAILENKPVVIRSPLSIRPWQHVLEPLNGYLILAEHLCTNRLDFSEAWNFGPDQSDAREVQWILNHISDLWGEGANWQLDKKTHPHEATYLKLDCSKAHTKLGWHPKLSLATTLLWIVEWYKHYQENSNMLTITLQEIERYEAVVQTTN